MNEARQIDNRPSDAPGPHETGARNSMRRGLLMAGAQLAALVLISVVFAAFDLDRLISAQFFDPDRKRWFLAKAGVWMALYRYGTIPGLLLAIGCLFAWLLSFFAPRMTAWRPYVLLVVLTTVVAGGILVNSVFKPYWGRPRPNQTTDFGGYYTYRHVFPPGIPGKGASFPCGHCTMGFTFLSLYFFRPKSRALAWSGVAAGVVLGGLLSAARIVQGAHFVTDTLWSLGMVSMTATVLYYCVLKIPAAPRTSRPARLTARTRKVLIIGTCLAVLATAGAFMTRRPYYNTKTYDLPMHAGTENMLIEINVEPEKMVVRYENGRRATLLIHVHGFGWAYVDYQIHKRINPSNGLLHAQFVVEAKSYFSELDHTIEVLLPGYLEDRLDISLRPNPHLMLDKPVD